MEMPSQFYRWVVSTGVLLALAGSTFSSEMHVVLVPEHFHPGWPLNLAVTVHRSSSGATSGTVLGKLNGYSPGSSSVTQTLATGQIDIGQGETKLLSIEVPSTIDRKYSSFQVTVEASGGLRFSHKKSISKNGNESVVMVQMDRNIYKPGQSVHFRVIQLNKDTSPKDSKLTVVLENSKGLKVELYEDVGSTNGVTSRDYPLPSYAALGVWKVLLLGKNDETIYTGTFKVEEYVLPKFSVDARADTPFIVWGKYDTPPTIIVEAKYTYGKAVQGKCTLGFGTSSRHDLMQMIPDSGILEFVDIDWKRIVGEKPRGVKKTVYIRLTVDDVTGRKEHASVAIDVFSGDYKYEILPGSPEVIHSGLPTEFYVKISDHYGQPATGQQGRVYLSLPDMSGIETTITMEEGQSYSTFRITPVKSGRDRDYYYHDEAGSFEFGPVSSKAADVTKKVYWYISKNSQSIKIDQANDADFTKGIDQELKVVSTSPTAGMISYSIMSQGIILVAGNVVDNKLTITPTLSMCPRAKLVVYQLVPQIKEKSSEVIADTLEFSPSMCFDKRVQTSFPSDQQRTGSKTNLQVNVLNKDGSSVQKLHDVFYLAVDKSAVLLQGHTVLTEDKVLGALNEANQWDPTINPYVASNIFGTMGIGILTSMIVTTIQPVIEYHGIMDDFQPNAAQYGAVVRKSSNVEKNEDTNLKSGTTTPKTTSSKKIRTDFPDTWLWGHGTTSLNGQFRTSVTLPDSITSWFVSAFAVSDDEIVASGTPFELKAFKPFFVSMNLPYSIVKGEKFSLNITVFNYQSEDVNAVVSLYLDPTISITGGNVKDGAMTQTVKLPANNADTVVFEISAVAPGPSQAKLHAKVEDLGDPTKSDEVIRKMLIKPYGAITENVQTDVLIVDQSPVTKTYTPNWPTSSVNNIRLQVKVTGEVMGQALSGLESLVRIPTGCGEQNMIGLVPNIYGIKYIESSGREEGKPLMKAMIQNMEIGYKRQVTLYSKKDGSYSAWARDLEGSTWLTSFVMKSFAAASPYIIVDKKVVTKALEFLASRQNSNGVFEERGNVIHSELQPGTNDGLAMSVYCLLSVLESQQAMNLQSESTTIDRLTERTVSRILNKMSMLLTKDTKSINSPFLQAMTVYTLSLIQEPSSSVKEAINQLMSFIEEVNAPWLSGMEMKADAISFSHQHEQPTNLMSGAYTLMAYLRQDKAPKSIELMKWLQSQQNSRGGFGSTQDTVLVLQSLAEYGIKYKNAKPSGQLTVVYRNVSHITDISEGRAMLLQVVDIPVDVKELDVTLTGEPNTMAVVKFVQTSETTELRSSKVVKSGDALGLTTKTNTLSFDQHEIETCFTSSLEQGVGMYVASITLPSGEVPSSSVEEMLEKNPLVSQVEVEDDTIHLYIDNIPKEGYCVKTDVETETKIANKMSGSARLYSYYEPEYSIEKEVAFADQPDPNNSVSQNVPVTLTCFILTVATCLLTSLLACV